MLTDYGCTSQRTDAATGLNCYNARCYDPALGQFAQADSVGKGGLNRYGYGTFRCNSLADHPIP
jgi:RHS repeat-associated protein